jgi:hypothetical protein
MFSVWTRFLKGIPFFVKIKERKKVQNSGQNLSKVRPPPFFWPVGGCVKRVFSPKATKKYFERVLVFLILPCKIKKTSTRSLFYSSGWSGEILFTQPLGCQAAYKSLNLCGSRNYCPEDNDQIFAQQYPTVLPDKQTFINLLNEGEGSSGAAW